MRNLRLYFRGIVTILFFYPTFVFAQLFAPTSWFDPGSFSDPKLSVGDLNNDGDIELIVCGMYDNNTKLGIYTITNGKIEERRFPGLPEFAEYAQLIDYDKDGDLDVFAATRPDGRYLKVGIYRNINGAFFKFNITIPNYTSANSFSIVDYDTDGDLDLLISGYDLFALTYRFHLLENINDVFYPVPTTLNATLASSIEWADFDNDHDMDVIISASGDNETATTYHENVGRGVFSARILHNAMRGMVTKDFDNDGDLDLLGSNYVTIAINNGKGEFSEFQENIPPVFGTNAWIDYDVDGDLDLFYSSCTFSGSDDACKMRLFAFDAGSFTEISNLGLPPSYSFGFIDYDGDSDPDFINADFSQSRIFRNNLKSNPFPLDYTPVPTKTVTVQPINTSSLKVCWVNYNYYEITGTRIEMSTENGPFIEVAQTGPDARSQTITDLTSGKVYAFRVRAENEHGFSKYSKVIYGRTVDTNYENFQNLTSMTIPISSSLTDLDNDGDLDLIYSGYYGNSKRTHIMRNDAGTFNGQADDLPDMGCNDIDVADYDHDGDLDLLMSGVDESTSTTRTIIAINNGNFTFTIHAQKLTGIRNGFSRWVDINSDGYHDIYISGTKDPNYENEVLINQKDGSFQPITTHGLPTVYHSDFEAADFNNDGRIDIAVTGFKDSTEYNIGLTVTEVYLNQGNHTFLMTQSLGQAHDSKIQSADLDNDGDIDLVIGMADQPLQIFKNENGKFVNDTRNNLFPTSNSHFELGDLDNDGDIDILFSGNGWHLHKSVVYLNDKTGLFTEGYFPLQEYTGYANFALGDIDNDNDLDIFESGSYYGSPSTIILKNQTTTSNEPPQAPEIVKIEQMPGGFKLIIKRGTDDLSASKSLSVNLYVKDSNGKYVYDTHSDYVTGRLKHATMGNMFLNDSIVIQNLIPGTYTVGVQNIDNSFCASSFTTTTIQVDFPAPLLLINETVCEQAAGHVEVVGNNVQWFKDAGLTQNIASGNIFSPSPLTSDTTFYAVQKVGSEFSPILPVTISVDPMINGEIVKHGDILIAPDATNYQWFRNDSLLNEMNGQELIATIPGRYSVNVTRGACTSIRKELKVLPPMPTIKSPESVCIYDTVTVSTVGDGIRWYSKDVLVSKNNSHTIATFSVADTMIWVSQTSNMIEGPKAGVTWKVVEYPKGRMIQNGDSLAAPEADAYQWFRNDTLLTNMTQSKIKAVIPGVYRIRAANGACVTDTITFGLKPQIPKTTSPPSVCLNDFVWVTTTGEGIVWYYPEHITYTFGERYQKRVESVTDTVVWVARVLGTLHSEKGSVTWDVIERPDTTLVQDNMTLIAPEAESYQWYKDDLILPNDTTHELTISSTGGYHCRVANKQCAINTRSVSIFLTHTESVSNKVFNYTVKGETLLIHAIDKEIKRLSIYNFSGQTMVSAINPSYETDIYTIDISNLPSGVYIFVVNGAKSYRGKFIK